MAARFTVSDDGLSVLYTSFAGVTTIHRSYTVEGPAARFVATGNAVLDGADIDPGYDPAPTHFVPGGVIAGLNA